MCQLPLDVEQGRYAYCEMVYIDLSRCVNSLAFIDSSRETMTSDETAAMTARRDQLVVLTERSLRCVTFVGREHHQHENEHTKNGSTNKTQLLQPLCQSEGSYLLLKFGHGVALPVYSAPSSIRLTVYLTTSVVIIDCRRTIRRLTKPPGFESRRIRH